MAKQPPTPPLQNDHYKKITTLIESVKADNLTQFGEVKKEFGGMAAQLEGHDRRITDLEKDKIKRDAIDEYKNSHQSTGRQEYNAPRKQAGDDSGVTINKELLNALKYLGLVIAALAAAILAMKASP